MGQGDILAFIKNEPENLCINGSIDFWQRTTGYNPVASGSFFADRFRYFQEGAYSVRVDRSTDIPTWSKNQYSMKFECLTNVVTPSGTNYSHFNHTIEGTFFRKLIGKEFKIGYNFKASKVGTYVVSCRNGDLDRGFASTIEVTQANTWKRYYITVPVDAFGNYAIDKERALIFSICFSNNTDGTHPNRIIGLDAWENGSNIHANDAQVNLWDTIGATAYVSDIAVFDAKHGEPEFYRAGGSYDEEFRKCQRYFFRSTDGGGFFDVVAYFRRYFRHPVKMRDVPVMTSLTFNPSGQNNVDSGYSNIGTEGCIWTTSRVSTAIYWDLTFQGDAEL